MTLGKRILTARTNQGLSQRQLQENTKIKREYLSKLETDKLNNPTISTLSKIANGCGLTVVELLGGVSKNATDLELEKAKQQQAVAESRLEEVYTAIEELREAF